MFHLKEKEEEKQNKNVSSALARTHALLHAALSLCSTFSARRAPLCVSRLLYCSAILLPLGHGSQTAPYILIRRPRVCADDTLYRVLRV